MGWQYIVTTSHARYKADSTRVFMELATRVAALGVVPCVPLPQCQHRWRQPGLCKSHHMICPLSIHEFREQVRPAGNQCCAESKQAGRLRLE